MADASGRSPFLTRTSACPVCGGFDGARRKKGLRCAGYRRGLTVRCTREQYAGALPLDDNPAVGGPGTYAHKLCRGSARHKTEGCEQHHTSAVDEGHSLCPCVHGGAVTVPLRASPSKDSASDDDNVQRRIVMWYPYTELDASVPFYTLRYEPKFFLPLTLDGPPERRCGHPQCRCVHAGKHSMAGITPIPYRLPEIAADTKLLLLVIEGEKAVDAMRQRRWPATTNAAWHRWDSAMADRIAQQRRIVVIPDMRDADGAGYRRARDAGEAFTATGHETALLLLPDCEPGWGVDDWLDPAKGGHTTGDLGDLILAAPAYDLATIEQLIDPAAAQAQAGSNGSNGSPPTLVVLHGSGGGWSGFVPQVGGPSNGHLPELARGFTDTENGLRFRDQFGHATRYDTTAESWFYYHGEHGVWRQDDILEAERCAKQVAIALPEEAERQIRERGLDDKDDAAKALRRGAKGCWSVAKQTSLLRSASAELSVRSSDWDTQAALLNTRSGIVSLDSGEVQPHDPLLHLRKQCATGVDHALATPRWSAFLEQVFGGDQALIGYMQRAIGMSLYGAVREHRFFILYGTGGNGKGVFVRSIQGVLGDYARAGSATLLTDTENPQHPTAWAELQGVRFLALPEQEKTLSEPGIKLLTGGETIRAHFMRQDNFDVVPCWTVFTQSNHLPAISGYSPAIKRRVVVVNFPFTVTDEIANYEDQLIAEEGAGILAWAVRGAQVYSHEGLGTCKAVTTYTEEYLTTVDQLSNFLDQCCVRRADAAVPFRELYSTYQRWCEVTREKDMQPERLLSLRLREHGLLRSRPRGEDDTRPVVYSGIALDKAKLHELGIQNLLG